MSWVGSTCCRRPSSTFWNSSKAILAFLSSRRRSPAGSTRSPNWRGVAAPQDSICIFFGIQFPFFDLPARLLGAESSRCTSLARFRSRGFAGRILSGNRHAFCIIRVGCTAGRASSWSTSLCQLAAPGTVLSVTLAAFAIRWFVLLFRGWVGRRVRCAFETASGSTLFARSPATPAFLWYPSEIAWCCPVSPPAIVILVDSIARICLGLRPIGPWACWLLDLSSIRIRAVALSHRGAAWAPLS